MFRSVYCIRNKITGAHYVGQTTNIPKRFTSHRLALVTGTHQNPHLQNAWNKYGADVFAFEVQSGAESQAELDELEIKHMQLLRDQRVELYNARAGGNGGGRVISAETRERMRLAQLGKKHGPCSEERKRKIGLANAGKTMSAEARRKISEVQKGRVASEAAKANLRRAFADPEHREMLRRRKTMLGRKHSEATKGKMREAWLRRLVRDGIMPLTDGKKQCSGCKLIQGQEQFPKDKRSIDGLSPRCLICTRESSKRRAAAYRLRKQEARRCQ